MKREGQHTPELEEARLSLIQSAIAQRGAVLFRSLVSDSKPTTQRQHHERIKAHARQLVQEYPQLMTSPHELEMDSVALTQYVNDRFYNDPENQEPCKWTINELISAIRNQLNYEARRQYSQMYGEREENEETPTDKNGRPLRGAVLQSYYAKKARDKRHRELRENREKTIQAFRNLPLSEDSISKLNEARTIEDSAIRERQREEILAESISTSLGRELSIPNESLTYLQELTADLRRTTEQQRIRNDAELERTGVSPQERAGARATISDGIRRHPKLALAALGMLAAGALGVKAELPQTIRGLVQLAQTREYIGDPEKLANLSYEELVAMGIIDVDSDTTSTDDEPSYDEKTTHPDNESHASDRETVEATSVITDEEHLVEGNPATEESLGTEANVSPTQQPAPKPSYGERQLQQTGDELDEFEVAEQQGLLSNLYQLVEQKRIERVEDDEFFLERVDPELNEGRVNIFLLGLDERRADQGGNYRADAIIILSLDSKTGTIDMLNIPRDLHAPEVAEMANMPGAYFRINACSAFGGVSDCTRIIENATGLSGDIVTYANFEAFIELISKIGAVTIDIDESFINKYGDIFKDMFGINLSPGPFALEGDALLYYSRVRKNDTDTHRNARQQQVVDAVSQQLLSMVRRMNPNDFVKLATGVTNISDKGRFGFGEGISFTDLLKVVADSMKTGIGDTRLGFERHGAGWLNWLTGQIPAENQRWQTVPEGSSQFIGQTEAGGKKPSGYWAPVRNAIRNLLTGQ